MTGWSSSTSARSRTARPVATAGISTWVSIRIGDQGGRVAMGCNAAEILVIVNGRVYVFGMTNATTSVADHLGFASWTELLNSVTFDPRSAK